MHKTERETIGQALPVDNNDRWYVSMGLAKEKDLHVQANLSEADLSGVGLSRPITVLIVDDYALVRSAISQILTAQHEIGQVLTAKNYAEAEAQAAKLHPDIIWLAMHIRSDDSIAKIRRLRKLSPNSRIIVLSDVEDEQEAFAAIMAGAQGYRSQQDVDFDEIMTIISLIWRDEFVLRPGILKRLIQRLRAATLPFWGSEEESARHLLVHNTGSNGLAQLTTREREILQLISLGHRDRDIARGLHISEKTVQKHVQSILSKLGVQNRTEAAYLIHRHSTSI